MKKTALIISILVLCASGLFSYDMEIPKRTVEAGFNVDAGLSNNYFAANELLVKDLVIDFTEISDEISKDGLIFNTKEVLNAFVNVNLKNGWRFSLKNGFEGFGDAGISKDLFDFLGKGNKLNETLNFSTRLDYDLFFYSQGNVEWETHGFRIGAGASTFHPLIHAEQSSGNASFQNGPEGNITANVSMGIDVYSSGELEPLFKDKKFDTLPDWFASGWGLDLNGTVEHKLTETLQGRAYMRLPVIPGSLENKASMTILCKYETEDFLDIVDTGGESTSEISDFVYSKKTLYISRPFRMGAEVNWRPFGKWMIFNALFGFGVRYPWTGDAEGYCEFNIGAHGELFSILGFDLSSSYMNKVFAQRAGFMLNLRAVELDAGVSMQGGSFSRSWQGSGLGAYFGLTFGW